MGGRLLPTQRKKLEVLITRAGDNVDILRPDGTATENQFGKVDDGDVTRSKVGSAWSKRIYSTNDERPDKRLTAGGRRREDNPVLMFPHGTDVQEDDHIEFPDGDVYMIQNQLRNDTHAEYRVENVT